MLSIVQKVVEYGLIDKNKYTLLNLKHTTGDIVKCDEVSVRIFRADHNNEKKPNGFTDEINMPLSELINNINVGCAYMPTKMKDGRRKISNYLGSENMIALDVDSGCSILQARMIFKNFAHAIVTTRKHLALIDGVQYEDRFRVFLPLKTETPKDNDARAELIIRLFEMIGSVVDRNTKDSARFFYSSLPDSKQYLNNGVLFDWELLMSVEAIDTPNTDKHIPITSKVATNRCEGDLNGIFVWNELEDCYVNDISGERDLNIGSDLDDVEVKLLGVRAYLDEHFYQGNKGNCLFNAGCMMKGDKVFSDDEIVDILMAEWEQRKSGKDRYNDALSGIKNSLKYG